MKNRILLLGGCCLAVGVVLGLVIASHGVRLVEPGFAAGGPESDRASMSDPVGTIDNRYSYHPGTEALGPDEIRIVACGTGMPAARRGQAAACFLIELGNGDKFIFDIGSG